MNLRLIVRGIPLAIILPALILGAGEALAQKAPKGQAETRRKPAVSKERRAIALGRFQGARSKEIRVWALQALQSDFMLTDAEDFKKVTRDDDFAKMASDLGVEAVVVGRVERRRTVIAVRGADGRLLQEIVVRGARGPKLKQDLQASLPGALAAALGAAPGEADQKPEPPKKARGRKPEEPPELGALEEEPSEQVVLEEEEASSEADAEERVESGPAGPPLIVAAIARFLNRSLTFNDTLPSLADPAYAVPDHHLGFAPALGLQVQVYPAVFLGLGGFAGQVGLTGGFERSFPVASRYSGTLLNVPSELNSVSQEWTFGSRVRFPGEKRELGVVLAYGQHRFSIQGDEARPIVPDVAYSHVRFGGDARFDFGRLFAGAKLGLRLVLDSGELENEDLWFPNASGQAIDIGLWGGYRLIDSLDLVLGVDFVRYGFDFNPIDKANATRVAGGAVDQYLSGFAGIQFSLGGRGGTSASEASASEATSEAVSE